MDTTPEQTPDRASLQLLPGLRFPTPVSLGFKCCVFCFFQTLGELHMFLYLFRPTFVKNKYTFSILFKSTYYEYNSFKCELNVMFLGDLFVNCNQMKSIKVYISIKCNNKLNFRVLLTH